MKITVYDSYNKPRDFEAIEGETVFQLLTRNHIELDSPCQGHGSCHKCRIEIEGKVTLACVCPVQEGMVVHIWRMQGVRFKDDIR